jgi:hypothetical protein
MKRRARSVLLSSELSRPVRLDRGSKLLAQPCLREAPDQPLLKSTFSSGSTSPRRRPLVGRRDRPWDRHRRDSRSNCDHVAVGRYRHGRFEADAVGSEGCRTARRPAAARWILETHQRRVVTGHGARKAEARGGFDKARFKLVVVFGYCRSGRRSSRRSRRRAGPIRPSLRRDSRNRASRQGPPAAIAGGAL